MSEAMTRRRFLAIGAAAVGTVAIGGGVATTLSASDDIELIRETMGDGEMKVLVVYGTKSGCTMGIAEHIAEALSGYASVEMVAAEEAPDPSAYDAVIVGSGVRGGTWHEAARTWVASNADVLGGKPIAFYTCGLMITEGAEKEAEVRAYTDALIEETAVRPVDIGLFAGWNEPKRFSMPERLIMRVMRAPQGDFRDYEAVKAWASDLAPQLGLAASDDEGANSDA